MTDGPSFTRANVEEFLWDEAALLDEWQLDAWADLFTPDGRYIIPSTDTVDQNPENTLSLIDDDMTRIRGRVGRLKSRHAHREFPSSRTRRLITNVRVLDVRGDEADITANFLVTRNRNFHSDQFTGRYLYTLVLADGEFKIKSRRAELDVESLGQRGAVSIIV